MSDKYYEVVAQELQGYSIRPGLWTRAVAETGDEGAHARAFYIRLRVAELVQQEKSEHTRAAAEAKQQIEAEFRAQEEEKQHRRLQEESERYRLDEQRSAGPYIWLMAIGIIVGGLILFFLIGHILSR